MFEPKDLSITELKKFHKATQEKIRCAKDSPSDNQFINYLKPEFNQIKAEGYVVLGMLDEELDKRGYDPEKLFKGYKIKR